MPPEPFHVHFTDAELTDLRDRLARTRWSPEPGNDRWSYGTDGAYLRELVGYWIDGFDWRRQEAAVNEFSHYRVNLDGVPLHFVHERGKGPDPLPVVLNHGWAWTFWDWHRLIGPLTDPAAHGGDPADAFDVVVPSLPGYTFSTPLTDTPVTVPWIAGLWDRLLHDVLGYRRYGAAGGDWGAGVTMELGTAHRAHVAGIYLSSPPLAHLGGVANLSEDDYAPDEAGWLDRTRRKWATVASHMAVHTADPQTLAWALDDSPVGLAAWLLERRRNWSDTERGGLDDIYSRDFLLTTLSLYWLTRTAGTSLRIYADSLRGTPQPPKRLDVPTGIGVFPGDVALAPRKAVERVADVTHWSVLPRGGHFAPSEVPELYVEELRSFFRPLRSDGGEG